MSDSVDSSNKGTDRNTVAAQSSAPVEQETPLIAVWLALALIIASGLYGVYLGYSAKSKLKASEPAKTSLFRDVAPSRVKFGLGIYS